VSSGKEGEMEGGVLPFWPLALRLLYLWAFLALNNYSERASSLFRFIFL
jgi:hypothetical protein